MVQINLKGQRILLTGASRGIGLAMANVLAEAGATIIAQYRKHTDQLAALQERYPDNIAMEQADLAEVADLNRLVERCYQHPTGLDGLISNAGIALYAPFDMKDNQWLERWQRTQRVNALAPALLCRAFIMRNKKAGRGGRMVCVSSRAAFRGDTPEYMAYAASKGAVETLVKTLARGYGKAGFKIFGLAPGFVQTDMAKDFVEKYGEGVVKDDIALNELTQPEHIANFVPLLMSGKADHATGSTIDINAASYVR